MIGIEFVPNDFRDDVKILQEFKAILDFDFILIPDNPAFQIKPSSLVCAKMLQDCLGVDVIACISGSGKSLEVVSSWLLGAKYACLKGVACVSGDRSMLSSLEILAEAKKMNFEILISSANELEKKIALGLTHCITQPLYENFPKSFDFPTLINFMPIFSSSTFEKLILSKLDFHIPQSYQESKDLIQSNYEIYTQIKQRDFYLTPLNLKKQMPFFKSLLS